MYNTNQTTVKEETYKISLSRITFPTSSSISLNLSNPSLHASTAPPYVLIASSAPAKAPATEMTVRAMSGAEAEA